MSTGSDGQIIATKPMKRSNTAAKSPIENLDTKRILSLRMSVFKSILTMF